MIHESDEIVICHICSATKNTNETMISDTKKKETSTTMATAIIAAMTTRTTAFSFIQINPQNKRSKAIKLNGLFENIYERRKKEAELSRIKLCSM